jgi:hypothetical protein
MVGDNLVSLDFGLACVFFCSFVPTFLLKDTNALAPAIIPRIYKNVIWEGVGVLSCYRWHVVFVLLDVLGDFQDGVTE